MSPKPESKDDLYRQGRGYLLATSSVMSALTFYLTDCRQGRSLKNLLGTLKPIDGNSAPPGLRDNLEIHTR
jgi:hypothetical protein